MFIRPRLMQVRIFVPRGVMVSVLSDTVSYSYLVSYWALELKPKYAFVNYADQLWAVENPSRSEVSEADKHHPLLKDVKPLRRDL